MIPPRTNLLPRALSISTLIAAFAKFAVISTSPVKCPTFPSAPWTCEKTSELSQVGGRPGNRHISNRRSRIVQSGQIGGTDALIAVGRISAISKLCRPCRPCSVGNVFELFDRIGLHIPVGVYVTDNDPCLSG